MRSPILGAHTVTRSTNLADAQCINLYFEIVETKNGKDVGALYQTPGLDLQVAVGSGPIRGKRTVGANLYVVSGGSCYSVTPALVVTKIGNIGTSVGPVSMIDNGTQLAFFDGVNGYLVAAGVLSTISLPAAGPVSATYQDGFGLVNSSGTNNFYQSNLLDLSTWNPLNFSSAATKADNIVALFELRQSIFVLKQTNTEVWIDAGLSGFAFQKLQGVFIELGCAAAYSPAIAGEELCWLSQNTQGQGIVVMTRGYQALRISTHSIETIIAGYPTISDAIGYVRQQEGHVFYVLTFPTANATWAYDITASQLAGIPLWHQEAAFSNGAFIRHQANSFAMFNGKSFVGDYQNGNLYSLNLNTATDNGAQRKWLRSWRALARPSADAVTFDSLQIDLQTGINVPAGTAPQCMLRWSDDGGHTWSNYRVAAAGPTGATSQRVKFNRLGSTRRTKGLDRIFELSSSDQFGVGIIGAELEVA